MKKVVFISSLVLFLSLPHLTWGKHVENSPQRCLTDPNLNTSFPDYHQKAGYYKADFYKLALEWPVSFCNSRPSYDLCQTQTTLPQKFTIHGLWPYSGAVGPCDTAVARCGTGRKLLESDLSARHKLLDELRDLWPNLKFKPNHGWEYFLWYNEWKEHGRCLDGMKQSSYFEKTINVMKQIKPVVSDALKMEGITPKTGGSFNPQDIMKKIERQTKLVAEIKCNVDGNSNTQLFEIHFCLSSNFALMNCSYWRRGSKPVYKAKSCGSGNIRFPPA